MDLTCLLNPVPPSFQEYREASSTCSSGYDSSPASPLPPGKKQKMCKDAAIFAKGKIYGEIRYAPCEVQDEDIAKEHAKFHLYPMGRISEYCRHIPYNSEKKNFLEKTGRESFEVFQYTFKMPNDDREHTVMWDYNIGLVRITPFFKCCNFQKTAPARVLKDNPGLREITHSITGGALAAQGYWMPFDAAKAVAATFCHEIRYALTPLFGLDFLSLCVTPGDPTYRSMVIDQHIVQRCTEQATAFRLLYRESSITSNPRTPSPSIGCPRKVPKLLRPKPSRRARSKSGRSEESDGGDNYVYAPSTPPSSSWVALNTPRSVMAPQWSRQPTSSPMSPYPSQAITAYRYGESSSSEESRPAKRIRSEEDEDCEDGPSSRSSASPETSFSDMTKAINLSSLSKETRAACIIMRMNMEDARLEGKSPRSRRAST